MILKFEAQLHLRLGFNEMSICTTIPWHIQACQVV